MKDVFKFLLLVFCIYCVLQDMIDRHVSPINIIIFLLIVVIGLALWSMHSRAIHITIHHTHTCKKHVKRLPKHRP